MARLPYGAACGRFGDRCASYRCGTGYLPVGRVDKIPGGGASPFRNVSRVMVWYLPGIVPLASAGVVAGPTAQMGGEPSWRAWRTLLFA